MADSGHKTYNVTEELEKQREALKNKKSEIQKKIYDQNKIINLGIKHSFKNKNPKGSTAKMNIFTGVIESRTTPSPARTVRRSMTMKNKSPS